MRSNVAKKTESEIAYQEAGRVRSVEDGVVVVASGAAERTARRAVSCLVSPEVGDLVLLAVVPGQETYVLAVLDRPGSGVTVALEGDLHVKLPGGRFVLAAQGGVSFVSGEEVGVLARDLKVNARSGSLLVESLSYLGTVVQAEVDKMTLKAAAFDATVDRLSQRLKRAYRFVEEFEQLRAERVDYMAKKNMSLRGENTLVTAEELVKLDGAQIHVG